MKDICYGPIAPGQFFIDSLNEHTPVIRMTASVLTDGVFVCEIWAMLEDRGEWTFGIIERGWQVATINLQRHKRVSFLDAMHFAEQKLRLRDDEWRRKYCPNREPVKITRCKCGG